MVWKDKEIGRQYRKNWRDKNKQFVHEYLSAHSCIKCGFSDIRALDFDHIDPAKKSSGIARLMNGTPTIERLKNEITKCQVLCANCHRIKTHENKEYLNSYNTRRGIE